MKRVLRIFAILGLLIGGWLLIPKRIFYQQRRPTRAGKAVNRAFSWAASVGLTPTTWPGDPPIGTITLEVRGRKSGQPRSNVVTWVGLDRERYLVSMLGEKVDWVRNARAAGGEAVIRHRGRRPVRLEEVAVEQRPTIIQAYVGRTAISTAEHLGVQPGAPIEEFERIAPDHPVFRIVEEAE
jgi:deazaflavin-dependent oxidoreductase (nitroreductase family)